VTCLGSALVTGGGRRVGRAIALALARKGYDIALHYSSSRTGADEAADEIRDLGRKVTLFPCDLSRDAERSKLVPAAADAFPDLHVLVNCAGVFTPGRLKETTEELFDYHFAVNLRAPFFLSRDFARRVEKGQIVNIVDTNVAREFTAFFSYTLSKKALFELTRMAAKDLAPGIRVNAVCPGDVLPPPGEDGSFLARKAAEIPAQIPGHPDYIAAAVLFLLESPFITGECLFVDGGEHLR
jgi:NAD(P)-dependent dehydrogenase (short-subunit alcohol dehydrogenase family)